MFAHTPVMLKESIEALAIRPEGTYVDLTFGGGGHAKEILKSLRGGRLVAFDQDPAAAQVAQQLQEEALTFMPANARFMQQFLTFHGIDAVDGILADLGVSSYQIDTAARGFSTRWDGPLDMRMDPTSNLTAQAIVNNYSEEALRTLLQHYGEVPNAPAVARAIVAHRVLKPIDTTQDLKDILAQLAPRGRTSKYYAKVFQAFRIEVNDELGALKELLQQSVHLLKPQSRIVILSYHSLEDRLVKRFFRTGNFAGEVHQDIYGNVLRPFQPVYRKPLAPSEEEIEANPRARSARLRAAALTKP